MKRTIVIISAALVMAGCRRSDVRDFSVHVPDVTRENIQLVGSVLGRYGGIDMSSLSFDDTKKVLSLKYDSMQIAKKNIEMAIAKTGFTANGVTPESVGAKRKSAGEK